MTKEEFVKEMEALGYVDGTEVPCYSSTPFIYSHYNSNIIFFHFNNNPLWAFKWQNNTIYRIVFDHSEWIEKDANMSIATMIVLYI